MLVRTGYFQIQKSVYARLFRNRTHIVTEMSAIRQAAPPTGSVIILPMGLDDFRKMICVTETSYFDFGMFSDDMICV